MVHVEVVGFEGEAPKDGSNSVGLPIRQMNVRGWHLSFSGYTIARGRKVRDRGGSGKKEIGGGLFRYWVNACPVALESELKKK